MRKVKLLFTLALVMFGVSSLSSDAFALQCKSGQSLNSDECWTEVQIGQGYPTLVSRGHVLTVSIGGNVVGDNNGYLANHSTTTGDETIIGVAQTSIASGNSGLVLAKGRGVVYITGERVSAIASRDVLVATEGATLASRAGMTIEAGTTNLGRSRLAVALEAGSTEGQRLNSYINVL